MRHVLLFIATVVSAEMTLDDHPYCAIRYRRLCQGKGRHVACQFPVPGPGEYCKNYTRITFTRQMKGFITTYINRRRQRLAAGNERVRGGALVPRPQLMMQVDWDRELAMLAQRLADQCTFVHDDCRATVRYPYAGQTVGEVRWRRSSDSDELSAQRAIRRVLDAWWGERRRVHPKEIVAPFRITPNGMSWGDFSQLAVWTLRAVGCAAVRHDDPPRLLLVCDFSHTNMLGQRTLTPGPLAPCPVHSIRKPRSAFPLLCATIRFKKVPVDYLFDVYDQGYDDEAKQEDDIVELLDQEPGSFPDYAETHKFKPTQEKPRKKIAESKIKIEHTTEMRKIKVSRPNAKESKVRINEQHSEVMPNEEYSRMRPNEKYSKIKEKYSIMLPNDEHSKVIPNEDYSNVRPNEQYINMRPNEEYSKLAPNKEYSKVKPSKELRKGAKEGIRGEQRTSKRTNGLPFRYRSTFLLHDGAVSTERRLLPMLTTSHRAIKKVDNNVEHSQKRLHNSRVRLDGPPVITENNASPENGNLQSLRNKDDGTVNSLKKSHGVHENKTPLRVRWQQTRDRPSRPGAKALLTSRRPIVTYQRQIEKTSVKISLKMDKEDEDQLFLDTGFKLKNHH